MNPEIKRDAHYEEQRLKSNQLPTFRSRFLRLELPVGERDRIASAVYAFRDILVSLEPNAGPDGVAGRLVAKYISTRLSELAPSLNLHVGLARSGQADALYVTGLPADENVAPFILLAVTYALGLPFNYSTQNGGKLVMAIRPDRASAASNTQTTAEEFAWHTDDAAVARGRRVEWISLFGIVNPPQTLTGYVPIAPAIENMSEELVQVLFEPRFTVRVPLSFKLGDDIWTPPRPILTLDDEGLVEIAWPSYATRPVDAADCKAIAALSALLKGLDAFASHVPLDPGTLLTFSNVRGVHMRSKIGVGDRLVLRTYARSSLSEMCRVTNTSGPIFDTHVVVQNRQI